MSSKTSIKWREEGNVHFKEGKKKGSLSEFRKAAFCYEEASNAAGANLQERSSAKKNLALTHYQMFRIEIESSAFSLEQIVHHFFEMLQNFETALTEGNKAQALEWCINLAHALSDCYLFVFSMNDERKTKLFRRLTARQDIESLSSFHPVLVSKIWLDLSKKDLHLALKSHEEKDIKNSSHFLANCNLPFKMAEEISRSVLGDEKFQLSEEVMDFSEQYNSLLVIVESAKMKEEGDILFREALEEEEELNVEKIWIAIDSFKNSILIAREGDLESELRASSSIGTAFCALALKPIARKYFRHVITASEGLKPRIVHGEPWYKAAFDGLSEIRKELWEEDEKARQEQRKPILEELENDLKELTEAAKESWDHLLNYVYDKYPPKIEGWVRPEIIDIGKAKEVLRKACFYYHPDKNKKNGIKWEVLCEEILKRVTEKYQVYDSNKNISSLLFQNTHKDWEMILGNDELSFHQFSDECRSFFIGRIEEMVQEGAQGVILGCTEIELLELEPHLKEPNKVPLFRSAELHIAAIASIQAKKAKVSDFFPPSPSQ